MILTAIIGHLHSNIAAPLSIIKSKATVSKLDRAILSRASIAKAKKFQEFLSGMKAQTSTSMTGTSTPKRTSKA